MNFLLDTDILSSILKRNSPHHQKLIKKLQTYSPKQIYISHFTVCELYFGLARIDKNKSEYKKQLRIAIKALIAEINVIDIAEHFSEYYGEIRSFLFSKGQDIGVMDSMIAAQAIASNLTLVTHNTEHYQRLSQITSIPKLKLTGWIK